MGGMSEVRCGEGLRRVKGQKLKTGIQSNELRTPKSALMSNHSFWILSAHAIWTHARHENLFNFSSTDKLCDIFVSCADRRKNKNRKKWRNKWKTMHMTSRSVVHIECDTSFPSARTICLNECVCVEATENEWFAIPCCVWMQRKVVLVFSTTEINPKRKEKVEIN